MQRQGFTLSELLIALALMGVIAIFTVPKVLNSVSDGSYNSKAKSAAMMIQAAYNTYQQESEPGAAMTPWDLTPFMNYVKVDTTTPIDDWQTGGQYGCDAAHPCLLFQDGSRMTFPLSPFGDTAITSAVSFQFDPDGKYGGTTNGPAKAVAFILYYDGELRNSSNERGVTCSPWWGCGGPNPASTVPPWFSWSK